jgi:hypothetical protein
MQHDDDGVLDKLDHGEHQDCLRHSRAHADGRLDQDVSPQPDVQQYRREREKQNDRYKKGASSLSRNRVDMA